jgi:hypothetical protein
MEERAGPRIPNSRDEKGVPAANSAECGFPDLVFHREMHGDQHDMMILLIGAKMASDPDVSGGVRSIMTEVQTVAARLRLDLPISIDQRIAPSMTPESIQ